MSLDPQTMVVKELACEAFDDVSIFPPKWLGCGNFFFRSEALIPAQVRVLRVCGNWKGC